jgi:hypothetical protein
MMRVYLLHLTEMDMSGKEVVADARSGARYQYFHG